MSNTDENSRYPAVKGGVKVEDWIPERVFDSADYLDRKAPRYADDGAGASAAAAAKQALAKPKAKR